MSSTASCSSRRRLLLVIFATRSISLTQHKIVAQLQKDFTKVPDAELKEHFAAISRA